MGNNQPELVIAKQNIELLELMQEKTSGNRTADEDKLIQQLVFQLRMAFVETQNRVEGKKT